jgi:hypothetical protein
VTPMFDTTAIDELAGRAGTAPNAIYRVYE